MTNYVNFWKLPSTDYDAGQHSGGIFQCSDDPTMIYIFGSKFLLPRSNTNNLVQDKNVASFDNPIVFEGFGSEESINDQGLMFMDSISNPRLPQTVIDDLPDNLKSIYESKVTDDGILYVLTYDNGNEPVVIGQAINENGNIKIVNAIVLMDASGNQVFNDVTGNKFVIKDTSKSFEDLADNELPCKKQIQDFYEKQITGGDMYMDYFVTEWSDDPNNVEAVSTYGNKSYAHEWYPVLLDTTDNQNTTTKPKLLMRNNILRYADGSFAPVVGITAERKAECDVELYLDAGHTQKYCDAGAFDAEKFYNEHGMADLYDVNGNKVHVLRPWETTETKYSVGITRLAPVYHMDKQKGKSGKIWSGIFRQPVIWDGINVNEQFKLNPTALFADKICTIGNKARAFYYLFEADNNNCKSRVSKGGVDIVGTTKGVFHRTADCSQISSMQWCRANNANAQNPYPFAEGGWAALSVLATCLELYNGTKDLNSIYKSGTSSNESVTISTIQDIGGALDVTASKAYRWSDSPYGGVQLHEYISQWYSLYPCMESIIAASYANEMNIADGEMFTVYDNEYKIVKRLDPFNYDCIIIKHIDTTIDSNDVDIYIRSSITFGANYQGHLWCYFGGGAELVGTCINATQASNGNDNDWYLEYNQTKWIYETAVSKNDKGVFDFESIYKKITSFQDKGNFWCANRITNCLYSLENIGSSVKGDCYFQWTNNYWSTILNQRVRRKLLAFGSAYNTGCSFRHANAHIPVSHTSPRDGGSAQALLDVSQITA